VEFDASPKNCSLETTCNISYWHISLHFHHVERSSASIPSGFEPREGLCESVGRTETFNLGNSARLTRVPCMSPIANEINWTAERDFDSFSCFSSLLKSRRTDTQYAGRAVYSRAELTERPNVKL
jgi:hypothetical protein